MSPGVIAFPQYFNLPCADYPTSDPLPKPGPAVPPPPKKRLLPQRTPRIDPAIWPIIAARARFESLRDLAIVYSVSHEAIRVIVKRSGAVTACPPGVAY